MTIPRTHLARIARATLLAGLAGSLMIGTAFAGKPTGGGSTTSNFQVADGRYASTTTASGGTGTWVHARCYQNGKMVYEQYVKYGTTKTATLTLGPTPSWSGGSASCTGEDGWWQNGSRWRVNATDAFSVSG
jgi:hypothetical protein